MANGPWTLIGAGSIGSKLAVHLARAGDGPGSIVDHAVLSPHNAARHALLPGVRPGAVFWPQRKADALALSLRGLQHEATPHRRDVIDMLSSESGGRVGWSRDTWAIINATASLVVREALEAAAALRCRVIETTVFASGRVGLVSTEGPNRNPNTGDLVTEFYARMSQPPHASAGVLESLDPLQRESTGEGCGSMTMIMTDGRLSLFAAGMAEYLLASRQSSLSDSSGTLLIGALDKQALGVQWTRYDVLPAHVVSTGNGERWQVRVSERAHQAIAAEIERCAGVETGGVMIGRLSEVSRTFHVVDVLAAPEDSRRMASAFELGTQGLRQRLTEYTHETGGTLYCLGTWHNHLTDSPPSPRDRSTAAQVAAARSAPSVLLIKTPSRYRALLADEETHVC